MFQGRKRLVLLTIMFFIGTSMESENSEDLETPKHFPSQDIGIADGSLFKQPLKSNPETYLDINEHESKEQLAKDLPEIAVLGTLAGQNTKLDTGIEPAKSPKNDPDHLSYENSKSPDVSKKATASIERGETEKSPVFLKENEISGNQVQVEHDENIKKPNFLADLGFGKSKETQDPVTHKPTSKPSATEDSASKDLPTEDSAIEDSATKDSAPKDSTSKTSKVTKGPNKTTDKPRCNNEQTTKMPQKASRGKLSKADGRRNRNVIKVEESSESNAFRTYDASLACFVLNLVSVVVMANIHLLN